MAPVPLRPVAWETRGSPLETSVMTLPGTVYLGAYNHVANDYTGDLSVDLTPVIADQPGDGVGHAVRDVATGIAEPDPRQHAREHQRLVILRRRRRDRLDQMPSDQGDGLQAGDIAVGVGALAQRTA